MINGESLLSLALALAAGGEKSPAAAIEISEKVGQAKLVNSVDRLPKEIRYPLKTTLSEIERATGIVFGKEVDRIFVEATLPAGWKIRATTHAMWSNLLDDKDRKRAGIFFKAAPYDYKAALNFSCRYICTAKYEGDHGSPDRTSTTQVIDTSTETVVWSSEPAKDMDYKTQDAHDALARAWLNEKYPQHKDPFAYWAD